MLDHIPWVYVEVAAGLAACVTLGAILGAIVAMVRGDGNG